MSTYFIQRKHGKCHKFIVWTVSTIDTFYMHPLWQFPFKGSWEMWHKLIPFFLLSLKRWAKLNQKIRLDLQPLHVQMLTLVLESYITWTQMWVSMHQTLYVQFFFLMYLDFGGFLEGYIPHTYVGHRNFKKNEKSKQHSQKD